MYRKGSTYPDPVHMTGLYVISLFLSSLSSIVEKSIGFSTTLKYPKIQKMLKHLKKKHNSKFLCIVCILLLDMNDKEFLKLINLNVQ